MSGINNKKKFSKKTISGKVNTRLFIFMVFIVIAVIITSSFAIRNYLLKDYTERTKNLGIVTAGQVQAIFEKEIETGNHSLDEFLNFKYHQLSMDECLQLWSNEKDRSKFDKKYLEKIFNQTENKPDGNVDNYKRFMTDYSVDKSLGEKIRNTIDSYLKIKGIAFSVPMDKNGLVPFHHSQNSQKIIGDIKKDITRSRTNRIWDYLGKAINPDKVEVSEYHRDTGAIMIIIYAPIKLKGRFWGGVVTAYKIKDIKKRTWAAITVIIAAILAGAIFIFLIINILINKSLKPISIITKILANVGRGDFSQKVEFFTDDEIGVIADNLNKMIDKSRQTLNYVKQAATTLATSSEELTLTSISMSASSAEQAASVREISVELNLVLDSIKETTQYISGQVDSIGHTVGAVTSLEDMSKKIAENMKIVKSQSDDSIHISKEGENLVISATQTMHRIVESSKKITNILSMINDISEQINLLSLNASIEAARAGDSGKGFAVVAEEVGKLADNTSHQVKEIHSLSVEIEKNVSEGSQMVEDIRSTISAIMHNVSDNSRLIEEITDHTENQAQNHNTIKEVMKDLEKKARSIIDVANFQESNSKSMKRAMQQILDFTSETATGSEGISASSEELSSKAENLNLLVESFKTFSDSGDVDRLDS